MYYLCTGILTVKSCSTRVKRQIPHFDLPFTKMFFVRPSHCLYFPACHGNVRYMQLFIFKLCFLFFFLHQLVLLKFMYVSIQFPLDYYEEEMS